MELFSTTSPFANHQPTTVPVWAQNLSFPMHLHMTFTSENYWGVNLLTYFKHFTTSIHTSTTPAVLLVVLPMLRLQSMQNSIVRLVLNDYSHNLAGDLPGIWITLAACSVQNVLRDSLSHLQNTFSPVCLTANLLHHSTPYHTLCSVPTHTHHLLEQP